MAQVQAQVASPAIETCPVARAEQTLFVVQDPKRPWVDGAFYKLLTIVEGGTPSEKVEGARELLLRAKREGKMPDHFRHRLLKAVPEAKCEVERAEHLLFCRRKEHQLPLNQIHGVIHGLLDLVQAQTPAEKVETAVALLFRARASGFITGGAVKIRFNAVLAPQLEVLREEARRLSAERQAAADAKSERRKAKQARNKQNRLGRGRQDSAKASGSGGSSGKNEQQAKGKKKK